MHRNGGYCHRWANHTCNVTGSPITGNPTGAPLGLVDCTSYTCFHKYLYRQPWNLLNILRTVMVATVRAFNNDCWELGWEQVSEQVREPWWIPDKETIRCPPFARFCAKVMAFMENFCLTFAWDVRAWKKDFSCAALTLWQMRRTGLWVAD